MFLLFEVRRSTYYHRILRSPEKTVYEEKDELLRPLIQEIFYKSKERFGSEKIRAKLIEQGITVGATKVSKLMKEMGLNANRKNHVEDLTIYINETTVKISYKDNLINPHQI